MAEEVSPNPVNEYPATEVSPGAEAEAAPPGLATEASSGPAPEVTMGPAAESPPGPAAEVAAGPAAEDPACAPTRPPPPSTVGGEGRFELIERLGQGAFGEVWRGTDTRDGKACAVKLEIKDQAVPGSLINEYELLHDLKKPSQQQGFVELFYFGSELPYIYMVMEFLGKSLGECLDACGGKLNLKSTLLLAEQVLRRIEYLHSKGSIHRDIKPENIMMGLGSRVHVVYLVDFGLSEKYYELDFGHLNQVRATLTGTAKYSSLNAHSFTQSRRDDLESIGYLLIVCLRGTLPWFDFGNAKTDEEEEKLIIEKKKATKIQELCVGLPPEFEEYMRRVKRLSYKQRPEYSMLRGLFLRALQQVGPALYHEFQWLEGTDIQSETLEPIQPWAETEQPDDGDVSCCFGRRRRVAE